MQASDITPADIERYWVKVNKSDECWMWTAGKTHDGYGRFRIHPTHIGKTVVAHRVSFSLAHGELPDTAELDHTCHMPACVNPAHLRLVTPGENRQHRKGATRQSRSGVRGVYFDNHSRKWRAQVGLNGKKIEVGLFHSLEEASAAVVAKRLEVHTHNDLDRVA